MLTARTHAPKRRLAALIMAVALTLSAAAGSASAKGVGAVSIDPPHAGGWYPVGPTVTFRFDVDHFPRVPFPSPGDYLEEISSITCSGFMIKHVQYDRSLPTDFNIRVEVSTFDISTGPSGTTVSCTATYERSYAQCTSLFGVTVCPGYGPFASVGTETASATFKVDTTGPTNVVAQPSAPANAHGWYRTAGTVYWAGVDTLSGIYACQEQPFGGEDTMAGVVMGFCENNAGLRTWAPFEYKFDGTPPSLAPTVSPSTVVLGAGATASPNATDSLSGIDTASCDPVDTSTVGTHTVSCTATDKAGNSKTTSASYAVGYDFSGFAAPIDGDAVNVAKAGRAIPLKWRATDSDGNPVTSITNVHVKAASVACDFGESAEPIDVYATGTSGLQNLGDGHYQFNWATPRSYAGSCQVLTLDLGDGIDHTAEFRFEK